MLCIVNIVNYLYLICLILNLGILRDFFSNILCLALVNNLEPNNY